MVWRVNWRLVAGVAAALTLGAGLLWWRAGPQPFESPAALAPPEQAPVTAPVLHGDKRLSAWAQQLQMRLAKTPDDAATWRLLAQAQAARGDGPQSAAAWRRVLALVPNDAEAHAGLAQAIALQQQGRLAGEPARWIEAGLRHAPAHPALLALAGDLAAESGDRASARRHFEQLLSVEQQASAPGASARLAAIRARIDQLSP